MFSKISFMLHNMQCSGNNAQVRLTIISITVIAITAHFDTLLNNPLFTDTPFLSPTSSYAQTV